jgi:hypothetical protein
VTSSYATRNNAKGLCSECPKPVAPGRIRCPYHLNKDYEKRKRYRNKSQELGRCVCCSHKLVEGVDEGYKSCQNCRENVFKLKW